MTPTWLRRGSAASPNSAEPEPAESGTAELDSAEPEPAEPGTPEPGTPEPGTPEPDSAEPTPVESGTAEPTPAESGASDPEAAAPRPPNGRLRKAALAGTAAVLVFGGCGFFYAAHQLRSEAPARNQALTDTEATTRVAGDVGNALARVFSYTPDGTAAAERSASTVLDGRAARQYETLFARVREDLTDQRVTLSTRAVRTGVIELDGGRARLLVFLDQTSRKGEGDAEATTAAAQLTVTARLDGDQWRIVDIKAR
ncbi:hypothetical protein PFZ55_08970 [Streptomyces sp. MS2A]|nr:hypothetical protein [Streptomyces sp. MS2A]